ncbi:MAG: hypothetical protein AB1714_29125 [Acidobacteriota bacterium]
MTVKSGGFAASQTLCAGRRPQRPSWLGLLLSAWPYVLLALTAFLSSFLLRDSLFGWDEGFYYCDAQRLIRGEVIYRDFFEFATPGTFFYIKWIWSVFAPTVKPVRQSLFVLCVLELWLVYGLSQRVLKKPLLSFLPTLLYLLMAKQRFWWSIHQNLLNRVGVLVCGWLLVRYAESGRTAYAFLLGLAAAATVCTTQHIGFGVSGIALIWLVLVLPWCAGIHRWRGLAGFAAGFVVPIAALVGYLTVNGALDAAWERTIVWPIEVYRPYHWRPYFEEGGRVMAEAWGECPSWKSFRDLTRLALIWYGPPIGLLLGLIPVARVLRRAPDRRAAVREAAPRAILWMIAALLLCGTLVEASEARLTQNGCLSLVFLVEFLASPYLGDLLKWVRPGIRDGSPLPVADRRPRGEPAARFIRTVCRFATAALLVPLALLYADTVDRLITTTTVALRASHRRAFVRTDLGEFWTLKRQLAEDLTTVVEYVVTTTSPHDPILVYYWSPHLYAVTQRSPASRFNRGLPGYLSVAQNAEIVRMIEERRPALIVRDRAVETLLRWGDPRIIRFGVDRLPNEPVEVATKENYEAVLVLENFTVFAPSPAVGGGRGLFSPNQR